MNVKVKQVEGEEVAAEVLAQAIEKISRGFAAWGEAGMNRRAMVVLVSASTQVPRNVVDTVLKGIDSLKRDYCVPKLSKKTAK